MVKVIIDSSIFIEKIRTHKGLFDLLVSESEIGKIELCTSSIVLTELWMGFSMDKKVAVNEVEEILSAITIIGIGSEVGKKAGDLIRNKQSEGFDALIAATTIVHDMQLATLNIKHFVGINGLKLYKTESNSNKTEDFVDLIKKFPKVKGLTVENYDKRYREAMMKKHGRYLLKTKKNAKV